MARASADENNRADSLCWSDMTLVRHCARRPRVYAVNKKTERRGHIMADRRPPTFRSFTCPNCQALYQVVKGEAGPETTFQNVACGACGAPFPGREEGFVLKY